MGKLKELFMSREIDREDGDLFEYLSTHSDSIVCEEYEEVENKKAKCPCTFGICSECEYYEEES